MFNYKAQDFELIMFFSYTSVIPYDKERIAIDGWRYWDRLNTIVKNFDKFFNDIREMASDITNSSEYAFKDNKTVFLIRRKSDRKMFFIGSCDGTCAIGTECFVHGGYIYDFIKNKKSDYVTQITAKIIGDTRVQMYQPF